jgi:hypothetical protein
VRWLSSTRSSPPFPRRGAGTAFHPALADIYRRHVASLNDALRNPDTRDEAFEIIRSLIDEIRLVPESGTLKIELRGESRSE